jgi:hypothetical protein
MKHLKINIPEGYEIDEAQSTFENIVFKPTLITLPKKWEELNRIDGCFVNSATTDVRELINEKTTRTNRNIFATKEQAEASIALAQLSQLMQVYNDGWVPDWQVGDFKYTIEKWESQLILETRTSYSSFFAFENEETAKLFLENFKDLITIAKPLL